jgi:hypothetical protein
MIFRKPEPLSAEAEQLLAQERELVAEAPDLRFRVMARARAASVGSLPLVRARRPWPPRRVIPLAGLGVLVASAAFAAWYEAQPRTAAPAPHPIAAVIEQRALDVGKSVSSDASRPQSVEAIASAPSPDAKTGRPHSSTPNSDAVPSAESLELVLLQRARSALNRGEYTTALRELAAHRRRFPTGPLREEREALRIKALEGQGKSEEARQAGEKFRKRYPKSVLSPQLGEAGRAP